MVQTRSSRACRNASLDETRGVKSIKKCDSFCDGVTTRSKSRGGGGGTTSAAIVAATPATPSAVKFTPQRRLRRRVTKPDDIDKEQQQQDEEDSDPDFTLEEVVVDTESSSSSSSDAGESDEASDSCGSGRRGGRGSIGANPSSSGSDDAGSTRQPRRSSSRRQPERRSPSLPAARKTAVRVSTAIARTPPRRRCSTGIRRAAVASLNNDSDDGGSDGYSPVTASRAYSSGAPKTPITESCLRMMATAVPNELPCREIETKKIIEHLQGVITTGTGGGCLYISGMPGTGKTATVMSAIRKLRKSGLPRFDVIEVNAMRVRTPNSVFQVIYSKLESQRPPNAEKAFQMLDKRFSTPNKTRRPCVLVVDEIDGLVTKSQHVLYTLFDWPTMRHSKLAVIAIANTMDLPERMIPRCVSRLGFGRLDFYPYTRDQIVEIITRRLTAPRINRRRGGDSQLSASPQDVADITFDSHAVGFCARKVANFSGDIRRALHICRRALEIAHANGHVKVQVDDVHAAAKEQYHSAYSLAIEELPFLHKLFLLSVALELRQLRQAIPHPSDFSQVNVVRLQKVLDRVKTHIDASGRFGAAVYTPMSQIKLIASKLCDISILTILSETFFCAAQEGTKRGTGTAAGRKFHKIDPSVDEDGGDLAVCLVPMAEEVEAALLSDPYCQKRLQK